MKLGRPKLHHHSTKLVTVRMQVSASLARLLQDVYGERTVAGAIRRACDEAERRALEDLKRSK